MIIKSSSYNKFIVSNFCSNISCSSKTSFRCSCTSCPFIIFKCNTYRTKSRCLNFYFMISYTYIVFRTSLYRKSRKICTSYCYFTICLRYCRNILTSFSCVCNIKSFYSSSISSNSSSLSIFNFLVQSTSRSITLSLSTNSCLISSYISNKSSTCISFLYTSKPIKNFFYSIDYSITIFLGTTNKSFNSFNSSVYTINFSVYSCNCVV